MKRYRLRSVFSGVIKSVDREKATVTALVSTRQVDRYQEIIIPEAFEKHLETYKSNPVFLWGHRSYGGPEMILGKAVDVRVVEDGLEATFEFAVEANPTAKMVFELYAGGFLKAFSIGGIAHKILFRGSDEDEKKKLPEYAYNALQDRAAAAIIVELELFEVSAVPVPANPGALAAGLRKLGMSEELLVQLGMDDEPSVLQLGDEPAPETSQLGDLLKRLEGVIQRLEASASPEPPAEELKGQEAPPEPEPVESEKAPAAAPPALTPELIKAWVREALAEAA